MKLIQILGYLFSLFFFLEISFRFLKPDAFEYYWLQKQFHKYSEEYLVDLEPNVHLRLKHFQNIFDIQFSTNEKGFRATRTVDNTMPQIGCIGDSVTMGFGVSDQDTFCKSLDGYLDPSGKSYQSINLAVDAYGPSAIKEKLKVQIPNLNLKVLYYFPSNGDDIDEYSFYSKMNHPISKIIFKYQFLASKYSYLFLALKVTQEQMVYRFRETFLQPLDTVSFGFYCITSLQKDYNCPYTNIQEYLKSFLADLKRPSKPLKNEPPRFGPNECQDISDMHPIPESVYTSTKEIISLANQNQIKIFIFLAPIDIETAYCSQRGKQHRLYNYSMTLKNFLIKEDIDFIDLNEYTYLMKDEQGRLNPRPYYIVGDGHYTEKGNHWVAEILKKKTKELLP
jgi:hypothetical protein